MLDFFFEAYIIPKKCTSKFDIVFFGGESSFEQLTMSYYIKF